VNLVCSFSLLFDMCTSAATLLEMDKRVRMREDQWQQLNDAAALVEWLWTDEHDNQMVAELDGAIRIKRRDGDEFSMRVVCPVSALAEREAQLDQSSCDEAIRQMEANSKPIRFYIDART
jgi:hypothetical protein